VQPLEVEFGMKKFFFILFMLSLGIAWAGANHLERANRLFRSTEYKKALEQLKSVLESSSAQPSELMEAYRLSGLCNAALGISSKSEYDFLRLLILNPSFRLPESVSPKLRPPFQKALVKLSKMGALKLKSPKIRKLSPGKWKVQLSLTSDPLRMAQAIRLVYTLKGEHEKRMLLPATVGDSVSFIIPPGKAHGRVLYRFEVLNVHGGVLKKIDRDGKMFFLPKTPIGKGKKVAVSKSASSMHGTGIKTSANTINAGDIVAPGNQEPIRDEQVHWWKSWWFWTAVGVVVVGAAAGTAAGLSSRGEDWPVHFQVKVN